MNLGEIFLRVYERCVFLDEIAEESPLRSTALILLSGIVRVESRCDIRHATLLCVRANYV